MDGVVVYTSLNRMEPMFDPEFLMTGNKGVLNVVSPPPIDIRFTTGNVVLETAFMSLSTPAPPGVDQDNFRDIVFEELLGTYVCEVRNVFGAESATTVIRECGKSLWKSNNYYC